MSLREMVIACIAFVVGAIAHSILSHFVMPHFHKVYVWVYSLRNHRKYGEACKTDMVLDKKGFSLGYSFDRRCPLWVTYILTKGSVGVDVNRNESFFPDEKIPLKYRVKPEDFTNSGFDKGHLAPSAAIDYSKKSNLETFAMSNVALQAPRLNRQAWGALEANVRTWTYTLGKLVVTTGPIYAKRNKRIKDIPVPKSFYKVVYSFRYNAWVGFLFPNEAVSARDLWKHAMTVKELEKTTGLKFCNQLGAARQATKKDLDMVFWKEHLKIEEKRAI